MSTSNNAINNTVGASISGVTNTLTVTNPSDTSSSAARHVITVGGSSADDPSLNFNVNGVTDWEMGIDNSDSDNLVISQGTALGTNNSWVMDTNGQRLLPLQPAFSAFLSATDSNVTGDSTVYIVGTNVAFTENFDIGSNFNTNGTFTAPIDGVYLFVYTLETFGLTSSFSSWFQSMLIGGTSFQGTSINPSQIFHGGSQGALTQTMSKIVRMSASDTAQVQVDVRGGSKTVSVAGNVTTFAGYLLG
ncbi:MAG: hypothetical protein ACLFUW_00430 [Bacteroidales bacterium]